MSADPTHTLAVATLPRAVRSGTSTALLVALAGCTNLGTALDGTLLRPGLLPGTGRPVLEAVAGANDRHAGTPLLLLRPGFTRRCEHLAGTLRALARDTPAQALCLQPEPGDGTGVADLARALAAQRRPLLMAGHSAGAAFAAALAAESVRAGAPVAGVLMLDPVPDAGFGAALAALGARAVPVHAWLAPAHACNANGRARAPLAVHAAAVVEAAPTATHVDAEGEDTDALAAWACGRPQPVPTQALRRWLADTANTLLAGSDISRRPGAAPSSPDPIR